NQPLADAAGNALELVNCLDFLSGRKSGTRLHEVVITLAVEMLLQAGVAATSDEATSAATEALDSGRALEAFARMVAALGGPSDFVEKPDRHLRKAAVILPVAAVESGWLAACST